MTIQESNILILGCNGMLGTDLVRICNKENFKIRALDLPVFDITDTKQLEEYVKDSDIVINCAAYTNVDGAETEKQLAYNINAQAVGNLGSIARKNDVWVIHISTDFVFDGQKNAPYRETDKANPISQYGITKLEGEKLLAQSGCNYTIMRVQWTYGHSGNNFVSKLIQRAKTSETVKVVDDQIGSPTATTEVANAIITLLNKKPEGLFHFANADYVSRYEMAQFIFDKLNMNVNLFPCKTSDYITPAKRPLNSRFDCSKISAILDKPIESWKTVLGRYLDKL